MDSKRVKNVYCDFTKTTAAGSTIKYFAIIISYLHFSTRSRRHYTFLFFFLFDNFCNKIELQKMIGTVDVKSAPVHFHVQRDLPFNTNGTPIPFNFARVNEGNAMDLTSRKFTAPRPGIYFFSFAGVASLYTSSSFAWLHSGLYLNGNRIGSTFVRDYSGPVEQWSPLTFQSTLKLAKGDQVWVQIEDIYSSSYLQDTHFTGFMLEEEIFDSL
jgi:hypothetical protein